MTLGPDDLPEDPFAETGAAQVVCGCTCDTFHFVKTPAMVRAVCTSCKAVAGAWPVSGHGEPSTESSMAEQLQWGRDYIQARYGRDTLPQPGAYGIPQAGAAWGREIPAMVEPEPGQPVPPLPAFSSGMCNAYLEGGPYDGQITWAMVGTTDLILAGYAYHPAGRIRDGRIVYAYRG